MSEFDFAGLRDTAQASFKPEFADVLRRSRRRRRARIGGVAAAAALAVGVAGGGAAGGLPWGERAGPGDADDSAGAASPTPPFLRTPSPSPSAGPVSRHGRTGPLVVGDVNHLYVRFYDCGGGPCRLNVAVTEDRGRTWRNVPLAVPAEALVDLRAVGPRTLVAQYQAGTPIGATDNWVASADGGATWRQVNVATLDAMPAGWRPLELGPGVGDRLPLLVADPVTGDVARLRHGPTTRAGRLAEGVPPGAGMWISGFADESVGTGGRINYHGSVVEVSQDGGRTWRRSAFPDDLSAGEDTGPAVATADGRTVYAVGQVGGRLVVHRSADGGKTWQRTGAESLLVGERTIRAAVRPDGALLVQAGISADESPVMLISEDGGETVRRIDPVPGAAAVPVTGGFTQSEWPMGSEAWITEDGFTWSFVAVPRVP
jgi:hypothetical protein